ncbi:hypothetical protein BGX26_000782 [Mortierella sp. AD094]|nr:hypothetical protein BGX26_000782 [Mortierella sp. AD094]
MRVITLTFAIGMAAASLLVSAIPLPEISINLKAIARSDGKAHVDSTPRGMSPEPAPIDVPSDEDIAIPAHVDSTPGSLQPEE